MLLGIGEEVSRLGTCSYVAVDLLQLDEVPDGYVRATAGERSFDRDVVWCGMSHCIKSRGTLLDRLVCRVSEYDWSENI